MQRADIERLAGLEEATAENDLCVYPTSFSLFLRRAALESEHGSGGTSAADGTPSSTHAPDNEGRGGQSTQEAS